MRLLFMLLLTGVLASCNTQRLLSYTVQTEPRHSIDPQPQKILLFTTYDPATAHNRKNAEEISRELTGEVLNQLADVVSRRMGVATEVVPGITQLPPFDNPVGRLLQQHGASHAIVLTYFDIAFEQTRVDVTKTTEGKSREAYYDICNTIHFELYDSATLLDKSSYPVCRPHSSRAVASGLLAFGPSYRSNKSDFAKLSTQNAQVFLRHYFPGEATVSRPVFTGKDFKAAADAMARNDWNTALQENQRIAESASDRTAAMALYNCAVLSERRSDRKAADAFLRQSMRRMMLPEAYTMARDFDDTAD